MHLVVDVEMPIDASGSTIQNMARDFLFVCIRKRFVVTRRSRLRIVIWLGVSTMVRSEVSIYTLVDASRCVHKGHHRCALTFRPDGSDQTLTFKM
jgi:hypothetical protein